jgi:hypothetical protein
LYRLYILTANLRLFSSVTFFISYSTYIWHEDGFCFEKCRK